MPQLDASTYAPQLVWLAITFVVLYLLMARFGLPKVGAVLERRRSHIGEDLGRAERMRAEAEAVRLEYESALAEARLAAQETLRRSVEELNVAAEARRRETSLALQQEAEAAEKRIAAARSATLVDLRSVASEVARAAAKKLTGLELAADEANAAVEKAMQESV